MCCVSYNNLKLYFQLAGIFLASVLNAQTAYTCYVNPFVGTGGHGHTFPGATTPFGMVQLSPDTRIDGSWDGCSGYHYSDTVIYGFSHTHLSGTGCSDYGDINFMPTFMSKPIKPITSEGKLFYTFDRKTETASPGYYTVTLRNGIKVELSASTRAGIQKYTYKRTGYAWITLDLNHRDQLLDGSIKEIDKQTFSGFRRSKAWAEDQLVYFYTSISKAASTVIVVKDSSGNYRLHLGYWVNAGESILVKTALSSVDESGARNNLEQEMPHWDFQRVKTQANAVWEQELRRIKVYGGTLTERQNFYTALYHCMIHPNVMNDADGRYRGRDKLVHTAEGYNYYTVFSLWDTYRALHPLLNIIDKKRSHDFMMSFKAQYEQSGRLPMWELWGNETNCMIGFHSVSVIWNAYLRGVITLKELAGLYPAIRSEAMSSRFGLDKFRAKGYLSIEDEHESVSKTLEYSFNMACVAKIAEELRNADLEGCQWALQLMDDIEMFKRYANAWRNLRNAQTGFMTPRSNGGWIRDFDPWQVNNHFTEANAWQYNFAVQHNAYDLLHRNTQKGHFYDDSLLSSLFNTGSQTSGRQQADITGLIGQYAHGNEPSHHVAYLFSSRDSVSKYVSRVCREMYHPTPDGLIGNEDCGQMSAWYVFSAMGFYPADPSTRRMKMGRMLFDSVRLRQGDGETVIYNSKSPEVVMYDYFSSEGLLFGKSRAYYADYKVQYATDGDIDGYYDPLDHLDYISAPVLEYATEVFEDSMEIRILVNDEELMLPSAQSKYKIVYTLDGSEPGNKSSVYKSGTSIWVKASAQLKARIILLAKRNLLVSQVAGAQLYKFVNHFDITLKSRYNKQYTAGGDKGIFDGLQGDADWRKGRWQGYQGSDFELIVDTRENNRLDTVLFGTLQDTRSWILFPKYVQVYGSDDGVHFEPAGRCENTVADTAMNNMRSDFQVICNGKTYRFLKIVAGNYGKLPAWHPGAGGDAFIFVDEIRIRSRY